MNRYMSIDDIVAYEKYPFSKGQMRSLITNRKKNGLVEAVLQLGRRVYLREDLFDYWLDGHLTRNKKKQLIPLDAPITKPIKKEVEDFLNQALIMFPLSVRTLNGLHSVKIITLGDLTEVTEKDLLKARNFGKRSLKEVKDLLKKLKLKFKPLKGQNEQKGVK